MDTMTTMKKIQDEYFTVAKKVQEPVVRYTGVMALAVSRYVPERPTFMAELPTMHEVVDHSLKFRKQLVDEQAQFVRQMVKAMHPVTAKFEAKPAAPKAAAKPAAAKPAAAKPAARPAARRVVKAA